MANALAATPLKNQVLHPAYELVSRQYISSLMLEVTVSRHVKTDAVHYHLAHDSDENAFLVAFRTQPMDSKGTAHILEHTALCGSQKYPVRDPFFSMIKRSLQTFMNAFTASDWTAYPFATQNQKDFDNLLSVYLDAAFYPNLHPLDFAQEGIRIELNSEEQPVYKGVVFNEMKGAMNGEVEQLYYALAKALYPHTTYHHNSGGDPAHIPELTHEELLAFHQAHYHPSNAIFMSFGNRPLAEIQQQCDEQVLSHFAHGKKFASVPETRLSKPVCVTESYAVDKITKKQTHHVLAWLLPAVTDPKQRLTMRLIEGILTEHAGSPLRALLESSPYGTAPSPLLGLDDNNFEMAFYAGVRGSEPEHVLEVQESILNLLDEVASKPIDPAEIDMVLHQIELNQRHIGGDGMPYGLTLLLDGLPAAVHDGDALAVWEIQPHLDWLHEQLKDENWLPQQIRHFLVDNPHRVRLTMIPDEQKAAKMQANEAKQLASIAENLTDSDKNALKLQARSLAERQTELDDLSLLPKVDFSDIPENIHFAQGESIDVQLFGHASKLHRFAAGTNGIYYTQVIIPLPDSYLVNPLLTLYTSLLSELGTSEYSAAEFQAVQAQHSGGIGIKISQRTALHSAHHYEAYLVLTVRALVRKTQALDLLKQCLEDTQFTELKRVKELLAQKFARWQARLSRSGHAYAIQGSNSSFSRLAAVDYSNAGLPAIIRLKQQLADYEHENTLTDMLTDLQAFHDQIMGLPRDVLLVAEADQLDSLTGYMVSHWQSEKTHAGIHQVSNAPVHTITQDTAWLIQTNVYHHAMSFPAVPVQHEDTPALMILGPYLQNNYLHRAIREQGGAYGGGAGYDANACTFRFYSYRDPRVTATYTDFTQSIRWLLHSPQQYSWLEEAIMGVIASVDKPGSPAGEAIKVCYAQLHGRSPEWQQALRKALLGVTHTDLQRVAERYLHEKPAVRVSIAPYAADEELAQAGFEILKMPS